MAPEAKKARPLTTILLAFLPLIAAAHPGTDESLSVLDRKIATEPRNAELFLHRGRIYQHDDAWAAALADYDRAAALGADPDAVDLARAELLWQADQPGAATVVLDRLLGRRPDHARALLTRARTRFALDRADAAGDDYRRALALSPGASPDLYLEVVRALAQVGDDRGALECADQGLERFGPLSVLAAAAIEIEIAAQRYGRALERLDRAVASSSFAERWLVRRAEVLELAGRRDEAAAAFEAALEALAKRFSAKRPAAVLIELERRARDGRSRIGGDGG